MHSGYSFAFAAGVSVARDMPLDLVHQVEIPSLLSSLFPLLRRQLLYYTHTYTEIYAIRLCMKMTYLSFFAILATCLEKYICRS